MVSKSHNRYYGLAESSIQDSLRILAIKRLVNARWRAYTEQGLELCMSLLTIYLVRSKWCSYANHKLEELNIEGVSPNEWWQKLGKEGVNHILTK